ncbi:MAG: hypothetical protein QW404_00390 [Candidatus Nanoarchaeia archaeon]
MKRTVLIFCIILLASLVYAKEVSLEQMQPIPPGFEDSSVVLNYVYNAGEYSEVVLTGSDLVPSSKYKIIMFGKPSCMYDVYDDATNQLIGSKGGWVCTDCTCEDPKDCYRTNLEYFANKAKLDSDPTKECIQGYLILDHFVSNSDGTAYEVFNSEGNSHFLWCHDYFCYEDFLDSWGYDIKFGLDSPYNGSLGLLGFSVFNVGNGGSGGGSSGSFGGSSGYGTQEFGEVPEFSAGAALVTLLVSISAFFLLRKALGL